MPQHSASRSGPTGWATPLSEPIHLKDGTTLATLGEAGPCLADHREIGPRLGWNEAASGLLVAADKPTPTNVEIATDRTKSTLDFGSLLDRKK